ncbi:MAG: YfhO family protein [Rhodothermus sp.]|nr:YfhO family protein [Rhodothermus sp.]
MAARSSRPRKTPPNLPAWHDWWGRLSERSRHLLCLLLLLALSLAFFAPIHFGGKRLIGGDTVNWRAMAQSVIAYRDSTGTEPLWATNAFAGMPAYMISYPVGVPQIDSLLDWLRGFLWPTSHFFFLLAGTYGLVVYLTRRPLAGMLAAVAYGLTTYIPIILKAGHNSKFIALCFAPWLALAFVYVLRQPRWLAGFLFAIVLAANLRAGHVQITYYVTFLLGLWWLVEGVAAWRGRRLIAFGRATGWLALGSMLALLMIAQPYWPIYEYKQYTIRGGTEATGGGNGLDWDYAMGWSQAPGELITLLIADAYGGGSPTYWGPKPFTEGPHYVGGIILWLALLALWRRRERTVWILGAGTLLMILFSLGSYFPLLNRFMFTYFPLFDAFRVPETWLSTAALGLALLAALGGSWLVEQKPFRPRSLRPAYQVWLGLMALVLGLWLGRGSLFTFERPGEVEQIARQVAAANNMSPQDPRLLQVVRQYVAEQRAERADLFGRDARRTLVFLLLAGGLLWLYDRQRLPGWGLVAGLTLLVTIDLWNVGRRHLNDKVLTEAREISDLIPAYSFDRFLLERQREAGGPGRFRVLSLESSNPMTDARPSYYHESIGGYHGAKLRLFQDYIDHLFVDPATGLPRQRALDLLSVRYVVVPAGTVLPGMQVVFEDERWRVLENPAALPRAFLVGQYEVVSDLEAHRQRLLDPSLDLRETVLLREAPGMEITAIDSSSIVSVELVHFGPREIIWQVTTDAPRLLVVDEIYYPAGWQAVVDGQSVPILQANYLLRAVPVPAGEHTVVMRFDPISHVWGLRITAIATLLVYGSVLIGLGLGWYRQRRGE